MASGEIECRGLLTLPSWTDRMSTVEKSSMPPAANAPEREHIRTLIETSAYLLDSGRFAEWIKLFDSSAEYELVSAGVANGTPIVWWKSARNEMERMLDDI